MIPHLQSTPPNSTYHYSHPTSNRTPLLPSKLDQNNPPVLQLDSDPATCLSSPLCISFSIITHLGCNSRSLFSLYSHQLSQVAAVPLQHSPWQPRWLLNPTQSVPQPPPTQFTATHKSQHPTIYQYKDKHTHTISHIAVIPHLWIVNRLNRSIEVKEKKREETLISSRPLFARLEICCL